MGTLTGEVLLVDDTPENLQVLGAILRGEGLTVRLATSGQLALRSVAARKPDLILLDIRMPDPNGLVTCRQLKTDPQTKDIPVLFLSASQEREERLEAFAAGGQDFIAKPFHAAEVLARVSTHLSISRLGRELASANGRLSQQVVVEQKQRHQAEGFAHDRQARLELALSAAGMGTWSSTADGTHLDFDAASQNLLGTTITDWTTLAAGFSNADRDRMAANWQDGLRDRKPFECEGWWQATGILKRLRLRGCVPSTQAGSDGAMIGLIWDVTVEHEARQRLMQGEKLESLGQLAGGVAHDFNNHLAVIVGNLDLLRRSVAHDEKAMQRLASIDSAALCASSLVRQLLTFARHRDNVMEPMHLAPVATDLSAMLGGLLGKRITLGFAVIDDDVKVLGCREQLQNAVLNLCINARDAMPDGGGLRLSVQRLVVQDARCRVTGQRVSGAFGALSVMDDGTGIPEAIQERIFEPFFTTKPEGKGTGLGLPTVVGCVKSHRGHLLLHSAPGKGTTFTILVPLAVA